jgi:hypothetical protein
MPKRKGHPKKNEQANPLKIGVSQLIHHTLKGEISGSELHHQFT